MGNDYKKQLEEMMDEVQDLLYDLNRWLYEHPELGEKEFKAQEKLTGILQDAGFVVEKGIGGLSTSFKAVADLGGKGLSVGFLAEYDALPEIGHGCGHNIIAASCLGAAMVLRKHLQGRGGRIVVFGTPAEETTGGKITMTEQGVFSEIDMAMSVHPSHRSTVGGSSLASHPLQISFTGRTAHAAASPQDGINALDAVIETYTSIRTLKNRLRDDVRIPGIIVDGGKAPNVVPDKATARFSIRAADSQYLEEVIEKVKNCARGAAMATGAEVEFHHYEPLFEAMKNNQTMGMLFADNLRGLGYSVKSLPDNYRGGSTDVGNVSQVVPTIHPAIAIGPETLVAHTKDFADSTVRVDAEKALRAAALAMAYTVIDIRRNEEILIEIYNEHNKKDT